MPIADCGFSGRSLLVRFGPTLSVQVGFDPGFRPERGRPPTLSPDVFPALVDTGAEECCIDNDLAAELDLPIVDRREIAGAHGSAFVNMYVGQVHVPSLRFTGRSPASRCKLADNAISPSSAGLSCATSFCATTGVAEPSP